MAIEKRSLSANQMLARVLRSFIAGPAFALLQSLDTAPPKRQLSELINHFHGPGLIDDTFTSS